MQKPTPSELIKIDNFIWAYILKNAKKLPPTDWYQADFSDDLNECYRFIKHYPQMEHTYKCNLCRIYDNELAEHLGETAIDGGFDAINAPAWVRAVAIKQAIEHHEKYK
jgi:hypothetical protein